MIKSPSTTKRIVMVDDEPDFFSIVRDWLEPRYELVPLTDGSNLLEELEGLDPDLLILDIRLPGPDGFKLCRQVRSQARFASLPILFLTASHNEGDFLRNLEAGGSSYLTKPPEPPRAPGPDQGAA